MTFSCLRLLPGSAAVRSQQAERDAGTGRLPSQLRDGTRGPPLPIERYAVLLGYVVLREGSCLSGLASQSIQA